MKHTLIINGHEAYPFAKGDLNATFVKIAKETLLNMGHAIEYISVDIGNYSNEQVVEKILWAENILYQTPVYWFGIPGKFKTFIDQVFNSGLASFVDMNSKSAYGEAGLLVKKKYLLSTTWNAPKTFFSNTNSILEGKTADDVFLPFHLANAYIGIEQLPGFTCKDVYRSTTIAEDLIRFEKHLKQFLN